jgi:hypothetical protein
VGSGLVFSLALALALACIRESDEVSEDRCGGSDGEDDIPYGEVGGELAGYFFDDILDREVDAIGSGLQHPN